MMPELRVTSTMKSKAGTYIVYIRGLLNVEALGESDMKLHRRKTCCFETALD